MIEQTPPQRKGSRPPAAQVDADGWMRGARICVSPNFDARPAHEISLLVIHNISLPPGRFGGPYIDALFTNTLDPQAHPYFAGIHGLRVSSHLLIGRNGAATQYVPFTARAWHAGVSSFDGRERCNDFSVGIELEGCDERAFTARQYARLVRVTRALMHAYPQITASRIAGHSDIAPGRKTDPGPCFDWARYRAALG
ncbi:1,6-anhydro-N-acetylmuramyl-L-alanine amidase AmpD [Solimonas marina]|uniref:1,6-anhydro-N-acetylmuramyl-L-alanine amidase AmpD n=1 Tax=Solimonas marina TaxID=2714601 RepID=A0A970B2Z7_9GAMM|nr:1,6-anhydro-N-acetylmuramyl-L-alanine amidase AmpD [Solimonas marina]NKF20692.1 1,6-anhydro-N-acetylmuramyl-L-alanine amidase AmpD [Solimonas marina]